MKGKVLLGSPFHPFLALALFSAWTGVHASGATRLSIVEPRLVFVGDILLSRNVVKERLSKRISPWSGFGSIFKEADWVMGNLEGAVGSSSECPADSLGPCFAIPESLIVDLREAGFSALSLANNHAMDLGESGRLSTHESLHANGLLPLGFDESPFFQVLNGYSVAFLAVTLVPGKDGKTQLLPGPELARKLRLARNFSDRIVVYIHWGVELQDWPDATQIKAARWLVQQGADLIIGAHPHVVQQPECMEGKPVFYSLGNHLFDQKYLQTKKGMIADCILDKAGFACRPRWTVALSGSFYPRLDEGAKLEGPEAVCPDSLPHSSKPAESMVLENIRTQDSAKYRWVYRTDRKVSWISKASQLLSAASFRLEGKPGKAYLFSLERHYSSLDKEVAPRPYVYEITPTGPIARWRGSALAWPLLDAAMPPENTEGILCALHRGDSFISPDPSHTGTRTAAYQWNGFGFSMLSDSSRSATCRDALKGFSVSD